MNIYSGKPKITFRPRCSGHLKKTFPKSLPEFLPESCFRVHSGSIRAKSWFGQEFAEVESQLMPNAFPIWHILHSFSPLFKTNHHFQRIAPKPPDPLKSIKNRRKAHKQPQNLRMEIFSLI